VCVLPTIIHLELGNNLKHVLLYFDEIVTAVRTKHDAVFAEFDLRVRGGA
jgi:hypothetical protein